jgi:hypothetical protein
MSEQALARPGKMLSLMMAAAFLFAAGAFAQTSVKPPRKVKGRVFSSEEAPKIRLKFDKKFEFAGSHEFVLYERARAEQYFFVEHENKKIKRMYLLQFEGFLPGVEAAYNYSEPRSAEIGGAKYFSNAESIPETAAALRAVPDSDVARAAKFLQDRGFILMKSLVFQRFVRVVGDDRRREMIVLYVEETDGKTTRLEELEKRALAGFKVLK